MQSAANQHNLVNNHNGALGQISNRNKIIAENYLRFIHISDSKLLDNSDFKIFASFLFKCPLYQTGNNPNEQNFTWVSSRFLKDEHIGIVVGTSIVHKLIFIIACTVYLLGVRDH